MEPWQSSAPQPGHGPTLRNGPKPPGIDAWLLGAPASSGPRRPTALRWLCRGSAWTVGDLRAQLGHGSTLGLPPARGTAWISLLGINGSSALPGRSRQTWNQGWLLRPPSPQGSRERAWPSPARTETPRASKQHPGERGCDQGNEPRLTRSPRLCSRHAGAGSFAGGRGRRRRPSRTQDVVRGTRPRPGIARRRTVPAPKTAQPRGRAGGDRAGAGGSARLNPSRKTLRTTPASDAVGPVRPPDAAPARRQRYRRGEERRRSSQRPGTRRETVRPRKGDAAEPRWEISARPCRTPSATSLRSPRSLAI